MEYNVNSMFGIDGEVAIITGASRGVGKEIALAMASLGAKVALISVSATHLFNAITEFEQKGFNVLGVPTDTTHKESVQAMVEKVVQHFGKIDILVNCAGVRHLEDAVTFDETKWDWVMEINLKGTFLICQAVGNYMVQRKKGKIVNVSSVYGYLGRARDLAYGPTNAAINQLTKTFAIEWARDNVNVNAVAPTFTTANINKHQHKNKQIANWVNIRIPKGKFCEPQWLVGPVIFLCSPCAEFITGHILYVDGGLTIS
jgi:NAD(P)-dependent dehydrogenase (short-subunit alcohol dehydrogenase family)